MKYNDINSPHKLLEFISKNINYGFISDENKIYTSINEEWKRDWYNKCIIQSPTDLLKSKYGTCFDQVELERKWLENNNYKCKTICIIYCKSIPNDFVAHTFLYYFADNKYYWFENAFGNISGIFEFDSEKKLIDNVKKVIMDFAIKKGKASEEDKKYLNCYEYNCPKENIHIKDFLNSISVKL